MLHVLVAVVYRKYWAFDFESLQSHQLLLFDTIPHICDKHHLDLRENIFQYDKNLRMMNLGGQRNTCLGLCMTRYAVLDKMAIRHSMHRSITITQRILLES